MAKPSAAATDLHPDDKQAIVTQYTRIVAGIVDNVRVLRVVEAELNELRAQGPNVTPIAQKLIENAAREYRANLKRAVDVANKLGIVLPVELLASKGAEVEGDVGAVTPKTFGGGKLGEERFRRVTGDILSGGIVPSASFFSFGEKLAAGAIAKVGAKKAVQLGERFASVSAAAARRGAAFLGRAGGRFITPAVETAIIGAVSWFAAATAIRIAAPGIGAGLGNLLSTPGGIVLVLVGGYVIFNRR